MENTRFRRELLAWYGANKRHLPWRETRDPYKIWLSEIILQQTQVVQGLSYYNKFVKHYPNVKQLAKAKTEQILKDWQGLGYYSRARNLHEASKTIVSIYKGKFPDNYNDILKLKGIGKYTAAAISSFAFSLPYAVLDGNVYRFLSRFFGISTPIDTTKGQKEFELLAQELLDRKDPATYNQAIMEFGSQYCKPVNPNCNECVFKYNCAAFKEKSVSQLPVKSKKTKIRNRYFNYFVIIDKNNKVIVKQRQDKDIWHGLFEFFLIESAEKKQLDELIGNAELKKILGKNFTITSSDHTFKHILSHQHIYADFHVIKIKGAFGKNINSVLLNDVKKLPVSRLTEKFINLVF